MAGEIAVVAVNSALLTTAAVESTLMSDTRDAATASHTAAKLGAADVEAKENEVPALWKDYLLLTKPRVIACCCLPLDRDVHRGGCGTPCDHWACSSPRPLAFTWRLAQRTPST
jgi:hypothetical protein